MSISPKTIAVQVALRTTQLIGSSQTQLEASYTTGYTAIDGKQIPASALKDAVVAVEAEFSEIIANDRNHPYRAALYGRSANLATGALAPSVNNGAVEFIGQFSGVNDATGDLPLTEFSIQEFRRYLRKASDRYTCVTPHFKFYNGRIYHTVTNAYIEGCIFSRSSALARFGSSTESPLPVSLESAWVARVLQFMVQEGWFGNEAQHYGSFAESCVQRLKGRETKFPTLPTNHSTGSPASD